MSLDLATVLEEAVDTACAFTAARYGIITTVDGAGEDGADLRILRGCIADDPDVPTVRSFERALAFSGGVGLARSPCG